MNVPIPFIGPRGSVRDEILSILSEEFPLSTKEIFSRVKKGGKEVSYQAVHKTLVQLVSQKVVEKKDGQYRIQKEWITGIRDHLTILEHQYQEIPSVRKVFEELKKGEVTVHFTSLTAMSIFTADLMIYTREHEGKPTPAYGLLRHAWWPLKFEPSHYIKFQRMDDRNPDNRVVIIQKDPFDKWIAKQYMIVNAFSQPERRLRFIPEVEWTEDLIVKGNLVLQTQYSPDSIKKLDEIYKKVRGLTDLFDA
ncbi:MAG: hypothetical protein AABW68_03675, partial [archaeon]